MFLRTDAYGAQPGIRLFKLSMLPSILDGGSLGLQEEREASRLSEILMAYV